MNFLVCVKNVVDTSKMRIDPITGRLDRNGAKSIINPLDLNALEAALSLRKELGGTVSVISMGPPPVEEILRDSLARGADKAYLITDRKFGGADTLATSYTLAAGIEKIGNFDFIFCGQESLDSNTAQVGPELAGMLNIESICSIVDLKYKSKNVVEVKRKMNKNVEILEVKLPALFTVSSELNNPGYPSIKGILNKKNFEIISLTADDLKVDSERIGIKGSPTQVRGIRPIIPVKKENISIDTPNMEESVNLFLKAMKKIKVI